MTPPLLIVGAPAACQAARQTLQDDEAFAGTEILTRFQPPDALALLRSRPDIGLALLLWQGGDSAALPALVAAVIDAQGGASKPVMVRSPEPLAEDVRRELWRLGTADRLFAQAIDARELADAAAAALRDGARIAALVAAAACSARLERAKTLWELADLILAAIHEQGIGRPGGMFCLLGGAAEPRLMIVAGSGRYDAVDCMPLEDFADRRVVDMIELSMAQRQSRFAPDAAVLYVETADDDVASIYLTLDAPLPSWQYTVIRVLTKAFSIAIGKNQAAQRLQRTQHATISTMATLAEYRDVDTGEHVARVARAATEIAQALTDRAGCAADRDMVEQIGMAAILHDIGKIAIPEGILLKAGPLDAAERQAMEKHAQLGREILTQAARRSDNAALLRRAAEIAHHHHERYDGTGYPAGLKGEEIPLAARIVALVDVFDALTSLRPYKKAWPLDKAIETIRAGAGSHFDPHVVEAFLLLEERRKSADFFVWTEAMSVGNPVLDLDHQRLIAIINRLWVAENGGNRQVIEFVLDDLVHYTESHFKREEEMLVQGGYPDCDRHARIHQNICRRLEEIRWEYFQGIREELRGEILEFLKDWLNQHILVEDMRYRPYLERPTPPPHAAAIDPEFVK
ncbi:MAG: bacteriohemerythrin [Rhodocyclaceae bacterium]|nr:bacteriohemerythrin [Rhodocyclaceae bacterium]